jgi:aspartate beta-hydroxylase
MIVSATQSDTIRPDGTLEARLADMLDQAITVHDEGELDQAETLYRHILAIHPEHAGALCYLGLLQAQHGRSDDAVHLLRGALASDPQLAEAHHHLGVVLQGLGHAAEALDHLDQALVIAPDFVDARCSRASALNWLGRREEAIAQFERVLAEAPETAVAELGLAAALEAAGREHEAFVHYRNAASLDPQYVEALDRALSAFAGRHPVESQVGMQRLNGFIKSMLLNYDNPRMNTYPGLTKCAFHDPQLFPVTRALEAAFDPICSEIAGLAEAAFSPELESHLMESGAWDVFMFYERGRKNAQNCSQCPTIARIIDSHNTLRTQAGVLYVSKLVPQSHIRAHRGPTNIRMRCHLGVRIPDGDCAIRVGEEVRRWRAGECLVFDDSLEHEAWNRTAEARIVLIVDVWHPELTPAEIAFLEGLHRFGAHQAESLSNYWAAKAQSQSQARKLYD